MSTHRGKLLSVRAAALYLGVGTASLRNAVLRHELAVQRHPSGRLAGIFEADADAWIARRATPPAPRREMPTRRSIDERMQELMPPPHERVFSH